MRSRLLTAVLVTCCGVLTINLVREGSRKTPPPAAHVRAAGLPVPTRAHKALGARLAELDMVQVPFDQALARLSQRADLGMDVRWDSLKTFGIMPDAPVTLHLKDVTLAQALTEVLSQVEASRGRASFSVVNGVIVVNANIEEPAETHTAVYNVRDLIELSISDGTTRDEAVERLRETLTKTIDSESWGGIGGRAGSIGEVSGLLVVTQTFEGHAQVARLLEQLRAASRGAQ